MSAVISVTERNILIDLRAYLIELFQCEVVAGYQNNVPIPENGIVMHMLFERNLDYTANYWDVDTTAMTAQKSVEATYQLDFYGSEANARARIVANLWQSPYTTERLKNCQPLYSGDPRKNVLVNQSKQFENRIMLELRLQHNPEISYQLDYVDKAEIKTPII